MNRVLNVLDAPSLQWKCWRGAFCVSLLYPVTVYCQNMKRNLKILPRSPCWIHLSRTVLRSRGSSSRHVLLLYVLVFQALVI